ncbi:hypothetical protein [Paenarthrobacter sp.]|uniref:hypothetical protein n=1 Tax=Paenarthrobacter sp. TaxID=1931993 RepID=UPI002810AC5B|nr:hypothetical protein [Paenarthrobacter sp.]
MLPTRVEIVPTDGIVDAVGKAVPTDTTISIPCLPHHGIVPTLRAAVQLSELGYTVVPHLAAKCVESEQQLQGILRNRENAGITEVFAIGGDATQSTGPYATGGELLRDIVDITSGRVRVGVAGYPRDTRTSPVSNSWRRWWRSRNWPAG